MHAYYLIVWLVVYVTLATGLFTVLERVPTTSVMSLVKCALTLYIRFVVSVTLPGAYWFSIQRSVF